MMDVVIAESGELTQHDLDTAEALVRAAFGESFRAHDWLHGVEGVHVLVTEDDALLAHASVVTRTLRYGSEAFVTGYVESVAVRADQQGRGLGRLVMDHAEAIIRAQHQLGAPQRSGECRAVLCESRLAALVRSDSGGHSRGGGRYLRPG
jgi:aminoglycoside 2'-N-acetyltransferase I